MIKESDVVVRCDLVNGELAIREVLRSSTHYDWRYREGDVLPSDTYGGRFWGDGWEPSANSRIVVFLTIMRRYVVTDCGYTESQAKKLDLKDRGTFGATMVMIEADKYEAFKEGIKEIVPNHRHHRLLRVPSAP